MKTCVSLLGVIFVLYTASSTAFGLTEVQGVISTNTTWTPANGPYILLGDMDISPGATLTVQPGVRIGGYSSIRLRVSGTLTAIGSSELPIKINGVEICLGSKSSAATQINIRYAEIRNCNLLNYNSGTAGTVTILDSFIIGVDGYVDLYNLTNAFDIERNFFLGSYGIRLGTNQQGILKNNIFYKQQNPTNPDVFAVNGNPQTFIYNSFLSTDRYAVKAKTGTTTISAANNYWNTTNTTTINSMIYDHADDTTYQTVSYVPILATPHSATPLVNIVLGTTVLDSDTVINQKYSIYDTVVVKGNAVVNIGSVYIDKLVAMDNSTVNISGANIGIPSYSGSGDFPYRVGGIWAYGTSKVTLSSCSISQCASEEKSNINILGEVSSDDAIRIHGSSVCDVNGIVLGPSSTFNGIDVDDNATLNINGGYVYSTVSTNNRVARIDIPTNEHLAGTCINISGGRIERIQAKGEINVFGKTLAKFPYDGKYQCGQVTGFWNDDTSIYLNLMDTTYPYIILHEGSSPPAVLLKSDLNGDGTINFYDIAIVSSEWLKTKR